jgi:PAS domain S-box-containing protein
MKRLVNFLSSSARWLWTIGAIGVMALAITSGAVFWTSLRMDQARQVVEEDRSRSLETIISANAVESAILDRQRILRGLVIDRKPVSGSELDLAQADRMVAKLANLAKNDRLQSQRVQALDAIVKDQAQRIGLISTDLQEGRVERPQTMVHEGVGQGTVSEARGIIGQLVERERKYLQDRRVESANIARSSETYTYAIGFVGLLVIVLAGTAVMISLSATWRTRFSDMERQLDDTIRYNAERMRIAHEATGAGTWEFLPDAGELVWSPEMFKLYGRDSRLGVPLKQDWERMLHDADIEVCPWSSSEGVPSTSFEATFRIGTQSGGYRWLVTRGFSFERDGRIRVVGMDVDVTEQVSNREELARLNELLSREAESNRRDKELVFETAGDLMAIILPDGTLTSANPAWSRVLGWAEDELVGRNISEFIPEGTTWGQADSAFATTMKASDGSSRIIEWSVARDAGGRGIAAGRDVTMQREAEVRLREAEDSIRQMQKIETVGQMTGGIAHDFNNMLTPIVGYLDMLQRRHVDDVKSSRMLNMAMQSADKARTLVSKLLSFARRQQLEYRVVDAAVLVDGMSELVSKAVAGTGVETVVEVDEGIACVRVDPNQFEMVLMNLAVNARDAMPQGGRVRITVRRALDDCAPHSAGLKPGPYVVVSVSDTGTGMDAETLRRAIEPFYSTKGLGKGTGLGLSMAHGMAAQCDGALVLDSAPGRGTVASVWLPEMDPSLIVAEAGESTSLGAAKTRPLRILLVDDEEIVRRSIEQMLIEMGHSVVTASSGAEALSLIATDDRFEMLVTDYLMPSMTGGQLIEKMREIHPAMPAVIVSGYTGVADQLEVKGAVRLAKPFTSLRLDDAMRRVVTCSEESTTGACDPVVEGNVVKIGRRAATSSRT